MGLVEPNLVWEAALGLYDLTLAAHVARISGRDPREYLPVCCVSLWMHPLVSKACACTSTRSLRTCGCVRMRVWARMDRVSGERPGRLCLAGRD